MWTRIVIRPALHVAVTVGVKSVSSSDCADACKHKPGGQNTRKNTIPSEDNQVYFMGKVTNMCQIFTTFSLVIKV